MINIGLGSTTIVGYSGFVDTFSNCKHLSWFGFWVLGIKVSVGKFGMDLLWIFGGDIVFASIL